MNTRSAYPHEWPDNLPENMIVMSEHEAFAAAFKKLYDHGMHLIDEVGRYINEDGREALRGFSSETANLYTTEAMRMSSRLMQAASWLLLERAAREKDMAPEDLKREKSKVVLDMEPPQINHAEWPHLPEQFRTLIEQSMHLIARIRHIDMERMLEHHDNRSADAIKAQIQRLHTVFGRSLPDTPDQA